MYYGCHKKNLGPFGYAVCSNSGTKNPNGDGVEHVGGGCIIYKRRNGCKLFLGGTT